MLVSFILQCSRNVELTRVNASVLSNPSLNATKSFIATKSSVVNPKSRTIVAVHGTYMGATKINHEQNHIGAIVDYLGRIDRGGLQRDTEILRY